MADRQGKRGKKDATLTESLVRCQWAELHSLTVPVSNTGVTQHSKDSSLREMDQSLQEWHDNEKRGRKMA